MGLIKTVIKFGVPIGFVYWTVDSGEWKPMGSSEDLKKTRILHKEYDTVKGKIEPYVKPYLPETINFPLNKDDLIESYNGMVKRGIRLMSNFDLVETVKTVTAKLETSVNQVSSSTESVESTSTTKSESSPPKA